MVIWGEDVWMVEGELGIGLAAVPRRRRRSAVERRLIVEETLVPGTSVARVAQKYDVNANQVFSGGACIVKAIWGQRRRAG